MDTVLIISGEKRMKQAILRGIHRSGISPKVLMECTEGIMALEILREQEVNMIITELELPDMAGLDLLKQAKVYQRRIKTVVIGGRDDFYYAVELLRLGIRDYMLKPIDEDQLTNLIRQLEEELSLEQKAVKRLFILECRQLKYLLMFYNQLSQQEISEMEEQSQKLFPYTPYLVACVEPKQTFQRMEEENWKEGWAASKGCLCLGEIANQTVFLIAEDNLPLLRRDELRDCYAGLSGQRGKLSELPEAYEEAQYARKQAFCRCMHEYRYAPEEEPNILEETINELQEDSTVRKIAQMLGTKNQKEALQQLEYIVSQAKRGRLSPEIINSLIQVLFLELEESYANLLTIYPVPAELKMLYCFGCLTDWLEAFRRWIQEFYSRMYLEFDHYRNIRKIQQAVEYIRLNYREGLNMAVVSNYVSMNYSLFSCTFKQYTGMNFVTFLKELRLREAKRLLMDTDYRITEISHKIGYENEKHFMKIFKETYGISPTEYRKSTRLTEGYNMEESNLF